MSERRLPSVPDVQGIADSSVARILRPLREIVHKITGRIDAPIVRASGATTAEGILLQNKLNELIDRLNS